MSDMSPETLEALQKSINHWERILTGEDTRIGSSTCALCARFRKITRNRCVGCPVREKTGEHYCVGSPYELVEERLDLLDLDNLGEIEPFVLADPTFKSYVAQELAFLKSLLPAPAELPKEANEMAPNPDSPADGTCFA